MGRRPKLHQLKMLKTQTQVSNIITPTAPKVIGDKLLVPQGVKTGTLPPKKPSQKKDFEEDIVEEVFDESGGLKKGSFLSNLLVKAAILALINLAAVVGIIYLAKQLPIKAAEVNRLRSEQLSIGAKNADLIKKDIEENKDKSDKLLALFPDDSGLVNFANELDKIRKEGKVTGFSFANNEAVKDKTGSLGIPVLIELKGTWPEIDNDLIKVQNIPFLLRAIEIDAAPAVEEGQVDFRFGGFLYVSQSFGKN